MTTNGDLLRAEADRLGIPLVSVWAAQEGFERAKKTKADVSLASLMLRHGRLTEEARAYIARDPHFPKIDPGWLVSLQKQRAAAEFDEYPDWQISPTLMFRAINDAMQGQTVDYVCDVGNHQMWAAHGTSASG